MIKFFLKLFLSPKIKFLFFGGIFSGLLVGCSSETILQTEKTVNIVNQTFSKTLSYESIYYSNETSNGNLDIEVPISVFAPEIENEKVSLQIIKTGDVLATFSLIGAKQFSQSFDEYGTYDLRLYLEKEVLSGEVMVIQRDTLIKEKAIDIRFLDDFSDYSSSNDWSVFPFNTSLIGIDNVNLLSEASTQKSFSDFDTDKPIKIDITYRVYHDNLPKGASLDNNNKLGLEVNDQNFYLNSNKNNDSKVRTIYLNNHGGNFDLKWIKFKSMVETPWKIISIPSSASCDSSATSSTSSGTSSTSSGTSSTSSAASRASVVSATLYQLSEDTNILVGYINFPYVDTCQPDIIYFNFYYEDLTSAGYTFGLTSNGIELDGSAFALTRGSGNYFFRINMQNGTPSSYRTTFGILEESNPYQFEVYVESVELSVP